MKTLKVSGYSVGEDSPTFLSSEDFASEPEFEEFFSDRSKAPNGNFVVVT